jgi:hypothetical protein
MLLPLSIMPAIAAAPSTNFLCVAIGFSSGVMQSWRPLDGRRVFVDAADIIAHGVRQTGLPIPD